MANGLGIFHKSHSFEMDADIQGDDRVTKIYQDKNWIYIKMIICCKWITSK